MVVVMSVVEGVVGVVVGVLVVWWWYGGDGVAAPPPPPPPGPPIPPTRTQGIENALSQHSIVRVPHRSHRDASKAKPCEKHRLCRQHLSDRVWACVGMCVGMCVGICGRVWACVWGTCGGTRGGELSSGEWR